MGDWETQIGLMKEVSLRISISNEYQPSQFRKNKYNEHVLLQDLEQYQFYSTLTKECFLYYGGNTIFHASGYTMDLNTYLKTLSVKERGRMWEKLEDIRDAAAAGDTFHTPVSYTHLDVYKRQNEARVSGVLLTGDIIDFPSPENLAVLDDALAALKVPYVYTPGNHDWSYFDNYQTEDAVRCCRPLLRRFCGGDEDFHVRKVGELTFAALDNSMDVYLSLIHI